MNKWLVALFFCLLSLSVQAEPLKAAEVFQLSVTKLDPNTFSIQWQIKEHYFLYHDRIKLVPLPDSNIHLGALRFPPPVIKKDRQGKEYQVYRNELSLPVNVLGTSPGESLVDIRYQGCADDGFCYPPEIAQIKLTIDANLALVAVNLEQPITPAQESKATEQTPIAELFAHHNWLMILFIFYGFGLLLSFTPCILPMVPILSGIIVGHGERVTTQKAFFLSLSYVLSMSFTYAVFGAVVALLGANLQISMQSPWAISVFSLIFVALAFSMFGFYELSLPQAWQAKIAGPSRKPRGGHYLGAAIMGCLATLILSPCVTAPLIGVLTYIAQSHNVVLGSLTLFFLSLGMGTPLLLIGTSAGKWLPETGSWMNAVKNCFGILFIGIAIFLIGRIIPPALSMGLWACLLIFSGIYTGALTHAQSDQEKFLQGVGIILLVYGLLILVGVSMGSNNPLQPLANFQAASFDEKPQPMTNTKQTVESVEAAIKQADGKPVMLDFYADWCTSCKVIEATTFKNPSVVSSLSHFKVIKIDVTDNSPAAQELMAHFKVIAPPTFIFFDDKGEELNHLKIVGDLSADEFLTKIKQINVN